MTKKHILIALVVLAVAGLTAVFVFSEESEAPDTSQLEQVENPTASTNEAPDPNDAEPSAETPAQGDETKQPSTSNEVSELPILANSYGQVEVAPITSGQLVSSTCTTEPGAECLLVFASKDSDKEVIFDTLTSDSQGVSVWEWKGGEDVPLGTWSVTAKVGNKKSITETLYIR